MNRVRLFLGLAFFLQMAPLLAAPPVATSAPVLDARPPYSTSAFRLTWNWAALHSAALGSDLWPMTWGPDGNLYAAWGDGGGFGGSDSDGRVSLGFARIEAGPADFRGVNLNGGKNPQHPASFPLKGKTSGIAFVDGILYTMINLQDGVWPDVNHRLAWSTDQGATWIDADWLFPKGEGNFKPAKFLQFSADYAGVPATLAGYVYLCGPKQNARPNDLFLSRVPRGRIREKTAYEFFHGLTAEGAPTWTKTFALAKPIFTDANGVTSGAVVFDPGIQRFLLACYHTGPGQLGVFDAQAPWGPWTTVEYEQSWGDMGEEGEGLSCEFPQKWMSSDGLTLWGVFSVYGPGARQGINAHDRFNLTHATLSRRSDGSDPP